MGFPFPPALGPPRTERGRAVWLLGDDAIGFEIDFQQELKYGFKNIENPPNRER